MNDDDIQADAFQVDVSDIRLKVCLCDCTEGEFMAFCRKHPGIVKLSTLTGMYLDISKNQ